MSITSWHARVNGLGQLDLFHKSENPKTTKVSQHKQPCENTKLNATPFTRLVKERANISQSLANAIAYANGIKGVYDHE